ncbi:MAG: hypothetical protein ACT4O5_09385 [Gammaproteobacteria bacterium]
MNAPFPTQTLLALTISAVAGTAHADATGPPAAVVRMAPAPFQRADASMEAVNDCATHIVARDLDLARPACDRAVAIAKRARPTHLRDSLSLAAALSNHALLELLSGDLMAAETDIGRARTLAPEQSFIARNHLAIEYAMSVRRIAQE